MLQDLLPWRLWSDSEIKLWLLHSLVRPQTLGHHTTELREHSDRQPKRLLVCLHFMTQGHEKNGQLNKLQHAEGSPRVPAVREPSHAREDAGGRGHTTPKASCHICGLQMDPPGAGMLNTDLSPPFGWWKAWGTQPILEGVTYTSSSFLSTYYVSATC